MSLLRTFAVREDRLDCIHLSDRSQVQAVQAIRRARRRRSTFFSPARCSDPAWDMLLDLYAAELEQRRLSTSAVSHTAGVPATTGLRHLDAFAREGLIVKRSDPLDSRRVYISLSASGLAAMRAYFAAEAKAFGSLASGAPGPP